MTPLITRMVKLVPDPETAMWFDMGDNAQRPPAGHVTDTEMFALPYPRCCVVCTQIDGSTLLLRLLKIPHHESVVVTGFVVGPGGNWQNQIDVFQMKLVDGGIELSDGKGQEPSEDSEYRTVLQHIEDFLLSLRKEQTAYKPTTKTSLINSKRAAKGKGPVLFDWHTVKIEPTPTKGEHQGGTHASPRLHDRRGHWRKYPSGKVGWVQNCKVGDAGKGVVFKDYEVSA